jgi:hypothetical protein
MLVCNEEDSFHKFTFFETCGKTTFTTTSSKLWKCISWMWEMVGKKQKRTTNLEEEGEFTAIGASLGFKVSDILQFCFDLQQKKHHPSSFFLLLLLRLNKPRRPKSQNPREILFCRTRRKDQEQQQQRIDPPNKTKLLADSFCEESNCPPIK